MTTYTVSNILDGSTTLRYPIDNSKGGKKIAIKSITVWIGWYNIRKDNHISIYYRKLVNVMPEDVAETLWVDKVIELVYPVKLGLKRSSDIVSAGNNVNIEILRQSGDVTTHVLEKIENPFSIDYDSGICTLTVPNIISVVGMTQDIRISLGFTKNETKTIHGALADNQISVINPYDVGVHYGKLNMWPKCININLKQLSTSNNILDGDYSTILNKISPPVGVFGESFTINFQNTIYKELKDGFITELDFYVIMTDGSKIDNHDQPISVQLFI